MEPSIPINGGMMRPIRAHAPAGTIMNADFPAAMGNRWVAVMRTFDALIGCLNQAVPHGIVACGAGQAGIISAAWTDSASGLSRVAVVEPFSGGSGGRVRSDGIEGTDTMIGYLKSTPIEHVEVETPLVVRRHALVPGRVGHGQWRGGASVCIELECRAPEVKITVRGLDRFRFQPWGAYGGHAGHSGEVVLNPDGEPKHLGRIRLLTMHSGDVLRMISPSGGGFGEPHRREPSSVHADWANGMIAESDVREVYAVVIRAGELDREATADLRAGMPGECSEWRITYGPERERYEEIWPRDAAVALNQEVMGVRPGLRRVVQEASQAALRGGRRPITPQAAATEVIERVRLMDR
jgi:N-methylhydantoinase B